MKDEILFNFPSQLFCFLSFFFMLFLSWILVVRLCNWWFFLASSSAILLPLMFLCASIHCTDVLILVFKLTIMFSNTFSHTYPTYKSIFVSYGFFISFNNGFIIIFIHCRDIPLDQLKFIVIQVLRYCLVCFV